MSGRYRKYAPIGLFLALVSALVSLLSRLSAGQITIMSQIAMILSVIGLVAFILLDPQSIRNFFSGRRAKFRSNSWILSLSIIGILVIINLFIYRNNISWDLTEDKLNTLTSETREVLSNINRRVHAQAFFSINVSTEQAETLLRNFERNAGDQFDFEFIDPYQNPIAANQAGITRDGTVILTDGNQVERLTTLNEESLLNAIIKLQNPEETVIYALTGHGENDFFSSGDTTMSILRQFMEAKNYRVETLNLLARGQMPDDAQGLFIAAPQIPLDEKEIRMIDQFLTEGGSLIFFSEPDFLTRIHGEIDPLRIYMLSEWGLVLGDDLVIDLSIDPVEIAIADQYAQHPITDEIGGYTTVFPTARSLTTHETVEITHTDLVRTSSQTWAETDIDGLLNNEAGFDKMDISGPITIAVAMENSETGARVVVVGDSDFATDAFINAYGNLDFAIAIVDWVSENEDLIRLSPRQITNRILIPPTRAARIAIISGGLIGLPLIIATTGIVIAIHRKKTG